MRRAGVSKETDVKTAELRERDRHRDGQAELSQGITTARRNGREAAERSKSSWLPHKPRGPRTDRPWVC